MKAVVFKEARKMVVEDVPDPEAGSGEVVWGGVCMEEISFMPLFWMLKDISLEFVFGWESGKKVSEHLDFIRANQDQLGKSITEIISIDEVPDAFERLGKPNTEMKVMVEF